MRSRAGTRGLCRIISATDADAEPRQLLVWLTFVPGVEDARKGQVPMLANIAPDISFVRLDLGVASPAEAVTAVGLNGQAYLLSSIPFGTAKVSR
jgi:hypothetical protein